jgi:hypothetical protein
MKRISLIVLLICLNVQLFSQIWDSLPGYAHNWTKTMYTINDLLYVSGSFDGTNPIGPPSERIATWDSLNWGIVPGVENFMFGGAYTFLVYNGVKYVGGNFRIGDMMDYFENVAYFEDNTWHQLGNSGFPNGDIYDILPYNGKLYIGGTFSSIGNEDYWCLVSWDGSNYEQVPGFNMWCRALVEYNGMLIAGGMYGTVATESGNDPCIAAWDGNTWHSILSNAQIGGFVKHMIVDSINNDLYVGGDYGISIDGTVTESISRYDGERWYHLSGGIPYGGIYPKAMCMYHRELYLGGNIDSINNETYNYLARWDGESFHHVGGGVSDEVEALYEYKDHLSRPKIGLHKKV